MSSAHFPIPLPESRSSTFMSLAHPHSTPATPSRNTSSTTLSTLRQGTSPLATSATSPNNIRSFSDAALAANTRNKRNSAHGVGAGTATPGSLPSPASTPPHHIPHTPGGVGGGGGKTRARDLLRKHYGLGVGPPPPLQGKVADPMDLDSTAFNAKAYYEQLITTSSLPMLIRRENELLTEIRQLDSERQSLVYNHHHELIAASDTIGAMKDRAEKLDADMDLLKAAFSEISRLSTELAIEDSRESDGGK